MKEPMAAKSAQPASPELLARVLKMSSEDLGAYLNQQMLENPVLEIEHNTEGITDGDLDQRKAAWLESNDFEEGLGYFDPEAQLEETDIWEWTGAQEETLSQVLCRRIGELELEEPVRAAACKAAEALDENGYLLATLEELAAAAGCDVAAAQAGLAVVRGLEPVGVGARDLADCLCLQLDEEDHLAQRLAREYLPLVGQGRWQQLSELLGEDEASIQAAVQRLRACNPKPGSQYGAHERSPYITPDVVVIKFLEEYYVALNDFSYPEIAISDEYAQMLRFTDDAQAKEYIQQKTEEAQQLQQAVEYRSQTLLRVAKAVVKNQEQFFRYGPHYLKLLRSEELARQLGMEDLEVRDALRGKFLQSPFGVYPMRYFIAKQKLPLEGLGQLKQKLCSLLECEDKAQPYTDEQLSHMLGLENLYLSEEQVQQLREEWNIPDPEERMAFASEEEHPCHCGCEHDHEEHCHCGCEHDHEEHHNCGCGHCHEDER